MAAQSFGEGGRHNIQGTLLVSRCIFSGQVDLDDLPALIQDAPSEIVLSSREAQGEGAGESLFFSHSQELLHSHPHLGFSLGGFGGAAPSEVF